MPNPKSRVRALAGTRPSRRFPLGPVVCALAAGALLAGAFLGPLSARQTSAAENGTVNPDLYSAMRWRLIGPYRAGRVSEVAGITGDPATYYIATPGGGVWKTQDAGRVWTPIFDHEDVASVGAVAVAPSDPKIVYAGTGEQTPGDGIYKSADAGATWTNIGLHDTQYISKILADPRDPNIIIVGVLGHPILGSAPPNTNKGVYKTTDGGKTWKKTLYKDDLAGVSNMCADPGDPKILYAALWKPRSFAPGGGAAARANAARAETQDSWIYKSTDEGSTWHQVKGTGLPAERMGQIGLAVAAGNRGRRVYAITGQGLLRSDDAGESWRKITNDPRIVGNNYICRVYADPKNPGVVYVMQTTAYRSENGGETFTAFKGAPGGDDYHVMWIDPANPRRMILGVDQGATISMDGGATWSSWYNQPTGQFYHVSTDTSFPYIAYAAQQDSGTAAVLSRSDWGEISFRDWFSSGGFEFCYIAADPLDPDIVFSGGWYGAVVRMDRRTGQIVHVFVRGTKYRSGQMAPLVFSPQNPHLLYLGTQYVLGTRDLGQTWQQLSPDLTERPSSQPAANRAATAGHEPENFAALDSPESRDFNDPDLPAGEAQARRGGGSISSLAPSPVQAGVIWAGTSNGLVQRTTDGGITWHNVSPSAFTPQTGVTILEPSHFDANTAYAAVSIGRGGGNPEIYRTHDAGKSWQKIVNGLPAGWMARVVREDPVRPGLLYAGTENGVYVSFDDGDHWQSLQLNLPISDNRDLAVHGDDLVVATYGRALWILDDLTPLREASAAEAASAASLLRPETAVRVRWDNDQETPLPPEVPAGQNPPDGAIIDYYLKSAPSGDITLEIHDAAGHLVRRYSSAAPAPDTSIKNVPDYWFGPLPRLSKNVGLNRFVWDLRYPDPPALNYSYSGNPLTYVEYTLSDHTIPGETPRDQVIGPLAVPGAYEAVLTVNGKQYRQPLEVVLDPRVRASQADLDDQLRAAQDISAGLAESTGAFDSIARLRAAVADREKSLAANTNAKDAADALKSVDEKARLIQLGAFGGSGVGPVNRDLARTLFMIETGDAAPSSTAQEAVAESCSSLTKSLADWRALNAKQLTAVNAQLQKLQLAPLPAASSVAADPPACRSDEEPHPGLP
ncbi:MAG TPA: hypothetical protein VN661_02035 [Candidatus Acidoferrales bacterium]|nr:hypothetical protein [Candidatus Acidoferrales bacterium]